MNFSHKLSIALIGAVATIVVAQPSPVVAISTQVPSITVAAETKAEDFYTQGNDKYDSGDKQGAIADYNEALRINPKYADAYYNRGITRAELGDKPGAIQDFQKAADLYQQQGDKDSYQKAINSLRRLQ